MATAHSGDEAVRLSVDSFAAAHEGPVMDLAQSHPDPVLPRGLVGRSPAGPLARGATRRCGILID